MVGFMEDGAGKQPFALIFVEIAVPVIRFDSDPVRANDIAAFTGEGETALHTALFAGGFEDHGVHHFHGTFADVDDANAA